MATWLQALWELTGRPITYRHAFMALIVWAIADQLIERLIRSSQRKES